MNDTKKYFSCFLPFNEQEATGVPFQRNFNYSILKRDHQKNSYESRAYESVDEKNLSCSMSRKVKKKN